MPALRAAQPPPSPRRTAVPVRRHARRSVMAAASAAAAAPLHVETPLILSNPLTAALGTGAPVFLKLEALQPCGSFKLRGIGAACQAAAANGAARLVSSSGGNAGLAVAHSARALGVPATVVLPRSTPEFVRRRLEAYGAEVQVEGSQWSEAHAAADALASAVGGALIHPFEGEVTWRGHASLVAETAAQLPHAAAGAPGAVAAALREGAAPGALVASVGGGGLLLGVLRGAEDAGWLRATDVVAAETVGADCLAQALAADALVTLPGITSVATSLGAPTASAAAFAAARARRPGGDGGSGGAPVHSFVATDAQAVGACLRFADEHRLLVEPACGAALAAVYERAPPLLTASSVVVVVCGGAVVDAESLRRTAASLGVPLPP